MDQGFQFLSKNTNRNIHWFCNSCKVLSKPILARIYTLEVCIGKLDKRVSDLDTKGPDNSGMPDVVNKLKARVKKLESSPNQPNKKMLSDTSQEVLGRPKQAKNLIVFRLKEQKQPERDGYAIEKLITASKLDTIDLESSTRLCRKQENANKSQRPRPQDKWKLIKAINKTPTPLQHAELKDIIAKLDKAKLQRETEKSLRPEFKARKGK